MNLDAALPRIAAQLETARQHHHIPGLSAALVHDQRILWSGGVGIAWMDGSPDGKLAVFTVDESGRARQVVVGGNV